MKTQRKLIVGFATMLALLSPQTSYILAQTSTDTQSQSRQFGSEAGEVVLEAQELLSRDHYNEALNKLAEASSLNGLSPYEQAMIFQMQGSCFYELDLYEEAITAFENAVSSGGLLINERRTLEFNIAQLLIATDQFEKGAVIIEAWHRGGGQFKKGQLEMLWQAWSQAGRYDKALPWAEQWFENAGNLKTRKHFDTLNFLYNNLGMPEKQMGIVEEMIEKWPDDKGLWDALASMLASNGQEEEAFELTLRQYDAGLVSDESALLRLVQYHSFYGIPYQGAQLMQKELERGRISKNADRYSDLADLWRQAREYDRAIPVLEKAVSLSGRDKAPMLSKLAEAYYHQGACDQANATISKIKPLNSEALASLYTQLGVCYYEQSHDLPKAQCRDGSAADSARTDMQTLALNAFAASTNFKQGRDKSVHKTALSWTNFIKGEQSSNSEMCEAFLVAERDQCFEHIDQAYKARVLVGKLIIDDECKKFKREFDLEYRPSTTFKISNQ